MSGDITFEGAAEGSKFDGKTTSGRLNTSGSFDSVKAESMSGNITIMSLLMPSKITAKATSGSITLTVPDGESEISVRYSTTSGRFSSDIPAMIQSKDARFDLSTMSGDIRILSS